MKHKQWVLLSALAAAGAIAAVPALGMDDDAMKNQSTEAISAAGSLPPEQVQGNVRFMSGGIGSDEAAAMRREESKYPLSLEFVEHGASRGEHLAGISVTIKDAKGGTNLTTVAGGPYFLAKLPPGDYKVTAARDGQAKTQDVVIAANKPERLVFVW